MKTKCISRTVATLTLTATLLAPAVRAAETPPGIQWQRTFGGDGYDLLYSFRKTTDGGYILGGLSDSYPGGNKNSPRYGGPDY